MEGNTAATYGLKSIIREQIGLIRNVLAKHVEHLGEDNKTLPSLSKQIQQGTITRILTGIPENPMLRKTIS